VDHQAVCRGSVDVSAPALRAATADVLADIAGHCDGIRCDMAMNLPGHSWQLTDILGQTVFERDGGELASPGLFVDLGPWQSCPVTCHLLALQ
jgi:hypothetical protein